MASTTTEQLGEQQPAKPAEATETAMVLAPPAAGGTGTVTTMTEHGAVDPNMLMLANIIAASQERIALDAAARDDKRERDAAKRQKTLLDALERSTENTNERFVAAEHDTNMKIERLAAIVERHKDSKAAAPYDAFFRTAEDRKVSGHCWPAVVLPLCCCCAAVVLLLHVTVLLLSPDTRRLWSLRYCCAYSSTCCAVVMRR